VVPYSPPKKPVRVRPLSGLNCAPVAIRGTKSEFLNGSGPASRSGHIQISSTVDRRGNAVGLHSFPMEVGLWQIATLEEYLREFSVRNWKTGLLTSFPRSTAPGEPGFANPGKTSAKAVAAQEVAIAGAVKRLPASQLGLPSSPKMGTGKTLMAMAIAQRICSRTPVRLSLRRTAAIASEDGPARFCRRSPRQDVRIGQSEVTPTRSIWPQGVNELRLGMPIVRDGVHTTLTDMKVGAANHKSPWDRWGC